MGLRKCTRGMMGVWFGRVLLGCMSGLGGKWGEAPVGWFGGENKSNRIFVMGRGVGQLLANPPKKIFPAM